MKEILLGVAVSFAPLLASAMQITSYHVWEDSRITVTDDPKDDLPGGVRNEWTIVLFPPAKPPARGEGGSHLSVTHYFNLPGVKSVIPAIPAPPTPFEPGPVESANLTPTAENGPVNVGGNENAPFAAVPEQTSTGALADVEPGGSGSSESRFARTTAGARKTGLISRLLL